MDAEKYTQGMQGTLGAHLGIRFVELSKERVTAELTINDLLLNLSGVVHGGTLMAFADTVGAVGTIMNLPDRANTATIESKTNFFAAGRRGTLHAESLPLHIGSRTMVWQTRVTDDTGRLVSMTVQTQIVIPAKAD
jgi:1,4-dihydroxy-2-naphthoyl-CoA hydrolase